jgi:hypothetical protein
MYSDRIDYGYKSSFSLNHYVQSIGLRTLLDSEPGFVISAKFCF